MLHDRSFSGQAHPCELPGGFKLLQGQYQIEHPLLSGGFGITYLARDSLDRHVVIKECFPAGLSRRSGSDAVPDGPQNEKSFRSIQRAFLREAHFLAKPSHPGIVGVHQVFRENQTAYIAMDFIDGLDLLTVREDQSARLSRPVVRKILIQVLDALECLHGLGILHRDIAPDNLLFSKEDKVTLIDFGAACSFASGSPAALQTVKDGYSANELYSPDLPQRPACDLYGLGATMHYLITGEAPAGSRERLNAIMAGDPDPCRPLAGGGWDADADLLASVDKALSVLPADRFAAAAEWKAALAPAAEETGKAPVQPQTAELPAAGAENLGAVIADLVARTNGSLTPGLPRAERQVQAQSAAPAVPAQAEERRMVNIFGEPVTDVEAWLQQEDSLSRRRQNTLAAGKLSAAAQSVSAQECTAEKPASGGRLRRFIRHLSGNPTT